MWSVGIRPENLSVKRLDAIWRPRGGAALEGDYQVAPLREMHKWLLGVTVGPRACCPVCQDRGEVHSQSGPVGPIR